MINLSKPKNIKIYGIIIGFFVSLLLIYFSFIQVFKILFATILLICILYKPSLGLYFTTFTLPLIQFRYVALLFLLTFISFVLNVIIRKDFKFSKIPMKYSITIFIITLVIGSITSFTFKLSIAKLITYIISFLFLFLSMNLIDSKKKLYYLILALVFAATLVGLYGLYQYKVGLELNESWVDIEANPNMTIRVISTFDNPNILAEYLILSIPLTLVLLWNTKKFFKKSIFLLSAGIQMLCILLTFSRGGWIGLFLSMIIFALFVDRKLFLIYGIAGLLMLNFASETIITRVSTIGNVEDTSTAYRIPLWKGTFDIIKNYWLNGIGLGTSTFSVVYPNYMRQGIVAAHSHNVFLQITTELGIFGLIGFIIFVFNSIRLNLILFVKSLDIRIKRISAGVIASISGVLLHGMVDHIFFNDRITLTFWIVISIGVAAYLLETKEKVKI